MGNEYIIQSETLTNIANAIREKSGKTDLILVSSMADEISNISGGGGVSDEQVKYVTFMDGETELYKQPVISGDTARDPVAKGYIEAPTKESTAQYDYTYSGWSTTFGGSASASALQNVTEDRVVYAAYTSAVRYYTVNFYDGETLVHTEQVAYGSKPTYAGIPEKDGYKFTGWSPTPSTITGDTNYYAQWFESEGLETASWARISEISAEGTAANYWAVGDTKSVKVNGTVGTLSVNATYYVYILGFNHNSEIEGNGITFGTFKSAASNGIDLCLIDSDYDGYDSNGTKYFNMNHWGQSNNGGWAGCDMRYDILGSTDKAPSGYGSAKTTSVVGYDASSTCATNPVANTLMAALPSGLRAVMKPMTKYTDGKGNSSNTEANVVATIDYLPLLAEFEIFGARSHANRYEQNKQKQYDYYAAGNSKNKYRHSATDANPTTAAYWWQRSAYSSNGTYFCPVDANARSNAIGAYFSYGIAPIFKV